jgi:AraC-like DNA-binding protein
MRPVSTLRAAHLLPYLEFCFDNGLPAERLLNKFRLPASLDAQPEAKLPILPTLKFLAHIERSACVKDIGILASRYVSLNLLSWANRRAILTAPTLQGALEAWLAGAQMESNAYVGWMAEENDNIRVCKRHEIAIVDNEETRALQIHFILLVLCVIRVFAGQNWSPISMGFRSCVPLNPLVGHLFPKTQFFFRQDCSWISLPKEMLGIERNRSRLSSPATPSCGEVQPMILFAEDYVSALEDYVSALKGVLKPYLPDGYPGIELAAEILGTSVRSLQRTLAECSTTYSKLIEETRVEAAVELLESSDSKIIDVAYAVGYEDPSHFSRAFRRLKGTSPREFRVSGAA